MYSPVKKVQRSCADFEFPHTPYAIQQELMEALYQVLEEKKIGIFESPTGTGKSLTLTCAALKWQENHEQLVREDLLNNIREIEIQVQKLDSCAEQESDWLSMQHAARKKRQELYELRQIHGLLEEHKQRLSERRDRHVQHLKVKQTKFIKKGDGNCEIKGKNSDADVEQNSNDEPQEEEEDEDGVENPRYREVQIYFCSRTHSQLAQVLAEVKRTAYGKRVRCLTLASRKQLCINADIKNLPGVIINERCLDMARPNRPNSESNQPKNTAGKCEYKKCIPEQHLTDAVLTDVLDIEDLVRQAKIEHACPYYATRNATPDAQLVFLPYQMLLHKRTRQQLGINLQGSIVIIDEAHNLLSTLADLHSCTLSLLELQQAQSQIMAYRSRYQGLFNAENLLRINQLLYVIKCLTNMFTMKPTSTNNNENSNSFNRIFKTYELMSEADFFNISLFVLLAFCERQRLAQKLQGFSQNYKKKKILVERNVNTQETTSTLLERMQKEQQKLQRASKTTKIKVEAVDKVEEVKEEKEEEEPTNSKSLELHKSPSSTLRPVLALLEALTENAEDGRIILTVDGHDVTKCTYKYVLLNPGRHFESVVHEARSIIIAGGTMQPTRQLIDQLFSQTQARVSVHIYDHVVPTEAVSCFVVKRGPCGKQLLFNFKQRNDTKMLGELGSILQNLCNVVPAGLVCFLPSYEYLDKVYAHLEQTCILERLRVKKEILCETRLGSGENVENLLANYKAAALSRGGALLFSVVGGKLSEGLNFTDDLGRGVIVVGMPYANRHTVELEQRMEYLENNFGFGQGDIYYENLCMKAVNQCIGRAVRHINDYACVFLLDERYAEARVQNSLPKWIRRSLNVADTFGQVYGATAKFFRDRKKVI